MDEYVIYHDAEPCGTVRMEPRGLYTLFSACCGARENCLYSLRLEGERGDVLLGVPEWRDGCYVLRRLMANRVWQTVGTVRCGRLSLRGAAEAVRERQAEEGWLRLKHPEYFFHVPAPVLACCGECYWKPAETGRYLAVPMEEGRPFLLPRYFCFAHTQLLWGKPYAVFLFDQQEQPQHFP